MGSVAAVAIRVKTADQLRIALAQRVTVRVVGQPKDTHRLTFARIKALHPLARLAGPETRGNGIERIAKILPGRTWVRPRMSEGADLAVPAGDRRLRRLNFLRAHAGEEVVGAVMLADVVEAQKAVGTWPVEVAWRHRRAEFTRFTAAGHSTVRCRPFHPSVPFARMSRHRVYIGRMSLTSTGPVAAEMIRRFEAALAPSRIDLADDSEQHRGHGGYNPAGESHFTLTIESAAFAGKSRVERQRMIHHALGDLLKERVHALTIRASAPGE